MNINMIHKNSPSSTTVTHIKSKMSQIILCRKSYKVLNINTHTALYRATICDIRKINQLIINVVTKSKCDICMSQSCDIHVSQNAIIKHMIFNKLTFQCRKLSQPFNTSIAYISSN